jgi:hypothetical protein
MSKHNKYQDFSSQIRNTIENAPSSHNSSSEKDDAIVSTNNNINDVSTTSDPVIVPEPAQVPIPPVSTSGTASTSTVKQHAQTLVDPDIQTFITLKTTFLDLNKTPILSKADQVKSAFSLLRLVQYALSKDKRVIYDEMYRFVKDNKNTTLNPVTVFAGGDEKMKKSEISVLSMFIAAFNRVQDGLGVDFRELERSLSSSPLLITYLSEKANIKKNR